jgi:protein transport protein SEC31
MKLKDISRTATFAWDTSSASESGPYIVTGDAAGAIDDSFSNDSKLEIWAPKFYERDGSDKPQGFALGREKTGPVGSVSVASR